MLAVYDKDISQNSYCKKVSQQPDKAYQLTFIRSVVGIKIEDQEFTCIVDEEGLLKKNLVPSIISTDNAPTNPQTHVEIVGSCFICNTKETNDGAIETSLTSSQIKLIEKHIVRAFTVKSQQVQPLLVATVEK